MDVGEISGLALADMYPRVILVNSNCKIQFQFFTLLHEYAHLLLKTDGMCLANSENFKRQSRGARRIRRGGGAMILQGPSSCQGRKP